MPNLCEVGAVYDRAATPFRMHQASSGQLAQVNRHRVVGDAQAPGDFASWEPVRLAGHDQAKGIQAGALRESRKGTYCVLSVHLSRISDIWRMRQSGCRTKSRSKYTFFDCSAELQSGRKPIAFAIVAGPGYAAKDGVDVTSVQPPLAGRTINSYAFARSIRARHEDTRLSPVESAFRVSSTSALVRPILAGCSHRMASCSGPCRRQVPSLLG